MTRNLSPTTLSATKVTAIPANDFPEIHKYRSLP